MTFELETARSEVVKLQLKFDSSNTELDNTRYALEFTKDEMHESNRQLSSIKQELHNAQRKHHQYQIDITDAKNEIAELKGELRQLSRSHCDYSGNAYSSSTSDDNHLKYRQDTHYTYTDNRQDRYDYNHGNMSSQYQSTAAHDLNSRSNTSHSDEPKFRLPYVIGKGDLKSFLAMFEIGGRKFHWNNDKQVEQLLCCLKDDALAFVTRLLLQTKESISALTEALERRYGDHLLPEHYRENLNQVRKLGKETLCEYAARVEDLVNKAYPTLNSPELLST